MSYTKKIWRHNEIITEDGLNHIETGIETNDTAIKKALQRDIVEINIQKVGPTETSRAEIVQKENGSSLNLIISKDVDENIIQTEEQGRVRAEEKRVEAERGRVLAEAERKKAEAARVLSESKRQQDTSAAIAKTEEATNAAVAKAQTATDNATTAANKAESAVAKLPLPLGNTLKGEAEATLVNVDDAYPAPLVTTKVLGQSDQLTTTGRNLVNHAVPLAPEGNRPFRGEKLNNGFVIDSTVDNSPKRIAAMNILGGIKAGDTIIVSCNYKKLSGDIESPNIYLPDEPQEYGIAINKPYIAKNNHSFIGIYLSNNTNSKMEITDVQLIKGSTPIAYQPYTGGKPSPSPEYSQEITNLNKAELVITGRNICPDVKLIGYVSYNNGIPVSSSRTQAEFPYVQQSESDGIGAVLNTIKGVTYSIAYLGKATTAAVGIAEYKSVDDVGDISKAVSYARVSSSKKRSLTASIDGVMVFILASQWSHGTTNINTFAKEDMIISIGEPCSTYTPHQSTVTPIDLKGNELLSIPNGVRDEVVIDAEGNVSLIKRLGKKTYSGAPEEQWFKNGETKELCRFYTMVEGKAFGTGSGNFNVIADRFSQSGLTLNERTNSTLVEVTILKKLIPTLDVALFVAWLKENPTTFVYKLAEPQTIPLGKVKLPALPESTSNIWNDGNIPANVYINYLKDVNIAYGKLESQLLWLYQ